MIAGLVLTAFTSEGRPRAHAPALALFGLGFALACLAVAVAFDTPVSNTGTYPIYTAYLGVALLAAAGVGMLVTALTRRLGAVPAWMLIALVFLPNALLMFNGYTRWSPAWGLAGYPETVDEVALFTYVRDHTPVDAIVIDVQPTAGSAPSFGERRSYFGGGDPKEASVLGYPREDLDTRRNTVVNLLLEPGLRDSTLLVLRAIPKPLYIVARHTLPSDMSVPRPERPIDAITKLGALPRRFVPVMRTGTLVLYRLAT